MGKINAQKRYPLFLLVVILGVVIIVGLSACTVADRNSKEIDVRGIAIAELALDNLDLHANPGVGVMLDFESEKFIVFHGNFGLFGYDLEKQNITFSVDFIKAVGIEGSVQGSHGTAVNVSGDGQSIAVYEYDVPTEIKGEVCYIDVPTLTYTRGEYRSMENTFESSDAVGQIIATVEIGTLRYTKGDQVWLLFG